MNSGKFFNQNYLLMLLSYYQTRESYEKDQVAHRIITLDKINKAFMTNIDSKHKDMFFFIIQLKNLNDLRDSEIKREGNNNDINSYFLKSKLYYVLYNKGQQEPYFVFAHNSKDSVKKWVVAINYFSKLYVRN